MRLVLADEVLIISAISGGNKAAFTKLYEFYHKKVFGYALSILKEQSAAEEVVQDVFMKIWMHRDSLASVDNFGAYLAVCTRNETLNAIKKGSIQQQHYQAVRAKTTELDQQTEQTIQLKETRKMLDLAIDRLPPQQKKVYRLLNIEGLKIQEVAEQLHISPSTAKAHLKTAVKNVRTFLNVYYRTMVILFFIFQK